MANRFRNYYDERKRMFFCLGYVEYRSSGRSRGSFVCFRLSPIMGVPHFAAEPWRVCVEFQTSRSAPVIPGLGRSLLRLRPDLSPALLHSF
jgi:hypothetical protein